MDDLKNFLDKLACNGVIVSINNSHKAANIYTEVYGVDKVLVLKSDNTWELV